MAEPSVHGRIYSVFRKALPTCLLSPVWPAKSDRNHTGKAAYYKHNGYENQASLEVTVIVAIMVSDATSVAG